VDTLQILRVQEPACGDLEWSDFDRPDPSLGKGGQGFYLSEDKTTTFIEFNSKSMNCMVLTRKRLKELTVESGSMLMALGGPESAASASMTAEFKTALSHSVVATPLCCLIVWLVTGNGFRAASPMFCIAASYFTGKAGVGICKCFFPI
jgi:hypothetical protein